MSGRDSGYGTVSSPSPEMVSCLSDATGSPYALYLGSSARITRLQAEHLRLCLNSFALKSGPDENEMVAGYLKKALNAAMSTIQTHYESCQTDLALSFATDVSHSCRCIAISANEASPVYDNYPGSSCSLPHTHKQGICAGAKDRCRRSLSGQALSHHVDRSSRIWRP